MSEELAEDALHGLTLVLRVGAQLPPQAVNRGFKRPVVELVTLEQVRVNAMLKHGLVSRTNTPVCRSSLWNFDSNIGVQFV